MSSLRENSPGTSSRHIQEGWPALRTHLADGLPLVHRTIAIRRSETGDASFVQAISDNFEVQKYLGGPKRRRLTAVQEILETSKKDGIYIAEKDESRVGLCYFFPNFLTCGMDVGVQVLPACAGQKVGYELLNMMLAYWRQLNLDLTLTITTHRRNIAAQLVLERSGFTRSAVLPSEAGSYVYVQIS